MQKNSAAFAAKIQSYFQTAPIAVANLLGSLVRSTLRDRNVASAPAPKAKKARKARGPNKPKVNLTPPSGNLFPDAVAEKEIATAAGASVMPAGTIY